MGYKKEKLNELISDLLSIICDKGPETSMYAQNAGRYGKEQNEIADKLKNSGLNEYMARNFLSGIGFLILPSINAVCKKEMIEDSRPHTTAICFNREDIVKLINEGIDKMAVGRREYFEELADMAIYFKHICSKKD
ncbi:hypothetical protein HYT26_00165 [Candidatus Pacearchaeota archaeon]|nr:hypothetical protein [Candidatus Pacearchaeota archaeon]